MLPAAFSDPRSGDSGWPGAGPAWLAAALHGLNPVHRMTPQALPFRPADFEPGALRNLLLKTDWGVLDCLGEITGVRRSVEVELPIGRCRVLTLPALIDAKSALDRPQDRLALLQLQAIHDRPPH